MLDEIDTLGLEQQAGLLRVIETGEYEPVGSNETKICHARIIVASNWNLEEAVGRGKFRQDLYYRLNVMSFHLPPLRERIQDIAPLVRGMAARFNAKFRKELFDISPAALSVLEAFPWPGNIRQLANEVRRLAATMESGACVTPVHLSDCLIKHVQEPVTSPRTAAQLSVRIDQSMEVAVTLLESEMIRYALQRSKGSVTEAAENLGISRKGLYLKRVRLGLMD